MNNFAAYCTPEQLALTSSRTLVELQALAKRKAATCMNCDELEWKLADCGLCFSCTTGEASAEDDFEIITTP